MAWRLLLVSQDKWPSKQLLLCPKVTVIPRTGIGGMDISAPPAEAPPSITTGYKHKMCMVNAGEDAEIIPPPLHPGTHIKLKH